MIRWEYAHVRGDLHKDIVLSLLNQAGAQGWEYIGIIGYQAYLKRPIQDTTTHSAKEEERG